VRGLVCQLFSSFNGSSALVSMAFLSRKNLRAFLFQWHSCRGKICAPSCFNGILVKEKSLKRRRAAVEIGVAKGSICARLGLPTLLLFQRQLRSCFNGILVEEKFARLLVSMSFLSRKKLRAFLIQWHSCQGKMCAPSWAGRSKPRPRSRKNLRY
jgi:hypothetical protein